MIDSLNDESSYDTIFNILVESNILKIKKIKTQMNDHIDNQDHIRRFNNLPPYLDYTLYMLTKSFPVINKYLNNTVRILLLVDKYDIHPSIYQQIYANILFSIYKIKCRYLNIRSSF